MDFRVQLGVYRGPLDLLLYLVRKHEVSPTEIPLHEIVQQYLILLEGASPSVDEVGDFIELATLLVEIKSRCVLPPLEEPTEVGVPMNESHEDLVQRLLEYKAFKDVASMLDEQSADWQRHFPRLSDDLTPPRANPAEQPIDELEVWDLINAHSRILTRSVDRRDTTIVYDDTPMPVHMQRIWEDLSARSEVEFGEVLESGMRKSSLIGMFLAVLELIRHQRVDAEQGEGSSGLWLRKGPRFQEGWHVMPDGSAAA